MAGESSTNSPCLLQGKELSCSFSEPQNRRKRRRTCEEPSVQQLVSAHQINAGFSDKNLCTLVSWPQNFTFQSNGDNKFIGGFKSKRSSFLVKTHGQLSRKSPSGIQRNLNNAGSFALDGKYVGSQKREDVQKPVDVTKEIEDETGANKCIGGFGLRKSSFLVKNHGQLPRKSPFGIQRNLNNVGLFALDGRYVGNQKREDVKKPVDITKKTEDEIGVKKYIEGFESKQSSLLVKNHSLFPRKLPSGIRTGSSALDGTYVGSEKREDVEKPVDVTKEIEDAIIRIESLIPSLQKLVNSVHSPKQKIVGDLGMPNLSSSVYSTGNDKDKMIMLRQTDCEKAIEKDVTLRPRMQASSVASTSSVRHNRTNNVGTSHQERSQSLTSERFGQEKGQPLEMSKSRNCLNRNTVMRKNKNGALNSQVVPQEPISEETSWSSCACSSETTQQSGSPSSSSRTYQSSGTDYYDSDESVPQDEKVGHSTRRKQPEVTDSTASGNADTSSYYNSEDEYSDVTPSSQMSSARYRKWDPQKERGKRKGGRLRRLGKRLGMIFHHHHHHHHHHYSSDKDEIDVHHARSLWKRLGQMFHHSRNGDQIQKQKTKKPEKSETKALVKRKQQGGHFHALVGGLMKHMKHSKKTKQVKNRIKGPGNDHHGGKKQGKKLPWWPKIHGGRGGVKVSNKGNKVKLGNYRSKSFAAAKMILKK